MPCSWLEVSLILRSDQLRPGKSTPLTDAITVPDYGCEEEDVF